MEWENSSLWSKIKWAWSTFWNSGHFWETLGWGTLLVVLARLGGSKLSLASGIPDKPLVALLMFPVTGYSILVISRYLREDQTLTPLRCESALITHGVRATLLAGLYFLPGSLLLGVAVFCVKVAELPSLGIGLLLASLYPLIYGGALLPLALARYAGTNSFKAGLEVGAMRRAARLEKQVSREVFEVMYGIPMLAVFAGFPLLGLPYGLGLFAYYVALFHFFWAVLMSLVLARSYPYLFPE